MNTQKLIIETPSYNERRLGKPYIAKMDFSTSAGTPEWGEFVGGYGEAGMLLLDGVKVGDVVMTGQKDFRKPRNSAPDFFILMEKTVEKDIPGVMAKWEEQKEELLKNIHELNWLHTLTAEKLESDFNYNVVAGKVGMPKLEETLGNFVVKKVTKAEAYKHYNSL